MTEIKTDYTSPYKYTHKESGEELSVKMKAVMSSAKFRFKLEQKNKTNANANARPHNK